MSPPATAPQMIKDGDQPKAFTSRSAPGTINKVPSPEPVETMPRARPRFLINQRETTRPDAKGAAQSGSFDHGVGYKELPYVVHLAGKDQPKPIINPQKADILIGPYLSASQPMPIATAPRIINEDE